MTDRVQGFTVFLDSPLREDDAHALQEAICLLHGVRSVQPVLYDTSDMIAELRGRRAALDLVLNTVHAALEK